MKSITCNGKVDTRDPFIPLSRNENTPQFTELFWCVAIFDTARQAAQMLNACYKIRFPMRPFGQPRKYELICIPHRRHRIPKCAGWVGDRVEEIALPTQSPFYLGRSSSSAQHRCARRIETPSLIDGFAQPGTRFAIAQVPKSVGNLYASQVQTRIGPGIGSERHSAYSNTFICKMVESTPN
jgi:hypothetical protein